MTRARIKVKDLFSQEGTIFRFVDKPEREKFEKAFSGCTLLTSKTPRKKPSGTYFCDGKFLDVKVKKEL